MKKARLYQKEIVKKTVTELSRSDRATVVMPCGSGKTLVALWIIERMKVKNAVIFAPTLGLLAQTAQEFLANTKYREVGCLAICSDASVVKGLDEIRPSPEECPFAVTGNVDAVQEYLEEKNVPVKFIFCTYQSSDILGLALLRSEITLEFAFFDEAHRTAGRADSLFTLALSDENAPIRKRLFMTATPRTYGQSSDRLEAFSMDDFSVYGQICAKMSFSEAVGLGIICPYVITLSTVDTNSLQMELLDDEMLNDMDVSIRDIAIRENILQALKKYNVKKIITYHSTIKRAERFALGALADVMNDYEKLHVSSEMTGAQRRSVMERFQNAERAIITNARCLTEGIDVPAADMVVFADPKYAQIDIVQAVGRVMRVSEGKKVGYVFLPVFSAQSPKEAIGKAIYRTRYDRVWKIADTLLSTMDLKIETELCTQGSEVRKRPRSFHKLISNLQR